MKIKFTDYNEFSKAKHILVYSGKNNELLKFDGYEVNINEKMKDLLDKEKVKYEVL